VIDFSYLDDMVDAKKARNKNRQLIESENLDDYGYDGGYLRNNGVGGGQLLGSPDRSFSGAKPPP
jgi:hypothetical protein